VRTSNYLFWLSLAAAGALLLYVAGNMERAGNKKDSPPVRPPEKTVPAGAAAGSEKPPVVPSTAGEKPQGGEAEGEGREATGPRVVASGSGKPVPGARVSLLRRGRREWVDLCGVLLRRSSSTVVWRTRTGEDGTFSPPPGKIPGSAGAPPGSFFLCVEAPGFAPARRPFPAPAATDLRFELAPAARLLVAGLPGPGVPVLAAAADGNVLTAESDSKGEARFENAPPGFYAVFLGDPSVDGVTRRPPPSEPPRWEFPFEVRPGETTKVDMTSTVRKLCEVKGKVAGGAHCEITLRSTGDTPLLSRTHRLLPPGPGETDAEFLFPFVPAGEYELVVSPALGKALARSLRLEEGDRREVSLAFPAATVTGVLLDSEGSVPLPGKKVRLTAESGFGEVETKTDPNGGFVFSGLAPGPYTLTVKSENGGAPLVEKAVFARPRGSGQPLRITCLPKR